MKTVLLAFSALLLLSGCATGHLFGPSDEQLQAQRERREALHEMQTFIDNIDTDTTKIAVLDALGAPSSKAIRSGKTVFFYDIPQTPLYMIFDAQGKIESFGINDELVNQRQVQYQIQKQQRQASAAAWSQAFQGIAQQSQPQQRVNCETRNSGYGTLKTSCN